MSQSELHDLLGRLEDSPTPEPSAAFVARLEAELRRMDQLVDADQLRSGSPRTRRARLLVAAGPVAALTAAAAAAAVTLLPGDPHPRRVTTADPGLSAPSPSPTATEPPAQSPTTVVAPPWLPATAAPPVSAPPSRALRPAPTTPTTRAPASNDHRVGSVTPPPAVTTTVPAVTTTVAPKPETLSLSCAGAMVSGNPAVSCAWSQSSAPAFAGYRLYREVVGTPRVLVFSTSTRAQTSAGDKTVQAGTTYSYRVEAVDAAGNVVGSSAASSVSCC